MSTSELAAADVLGRTCRELRGSHTTEELARAVTNAGLKWSTARVAHLEQGKVSPTVTTLLALAGAFSALLNRPLKLADLFAGDDRISFGDSTIDSEFLRSALGGQPVKPVYSTTGVAVYGREGLDRFARDHAADRAAWPRRLGGIEPNRHIRTSQTWTEADDRAVSSLGVSEWRAAAEMALLWGHSLSAQRDLESSAGDSQQRKGRISRNLIAQLREAIDRGDDN